MIPLYQMKIIQIDITNACINKCSNCTRMIGHHKKPFYMDLETYKRAVDSLVDFPGMVGMIGGEPLLHPDFPEMAHYLAERITDKKRRGLWSTIPKGAKHGAVIKEVFGNLFLNDHTINGIKHQPILVAAQDVVQDADKMWSLIDNCWVQTLWSASITPKGAFFCEVAAALDMLFDGPGGWPVEPGWWKREPEDFADQKNRWCPGCGCAIPLPRRSSIEEIDDVSPSNLERLRQIHSPKVRDGRIEVFHGEMATDWKPDCNWYMNELEREKELAYRDAIKARIDDLS